MTQLKQGANVTTTEECVHLIDLGYDLRFIGNWHFVSDQHNEYRDVAASVLVDYFTEEAKDEAALAELKARKAVRITQASKG